MRVIGAFILLLLMGCGVASFFLLENSVISESIIPESNVVIGQATATLHPVIDPAYSPVTYEPSTPVSAMQTSPLTEDSQMATLQAVIAAYPNVYPLDIFKVVNATAYAETVVANPNLTATIPACRLGDVISFTSDLEAELMEQAQEQPTMFYGTVTGVLVTEDCQRYHLTSTVLELDVPPDVIQTDLAAYFDTIAQVILSNEHSEQITTVRLTVDDTNERYIVLSIPYDEFQANYEDGLTGLNLFLPRSD